MVGEIKETCTHIHRNFSGAVEAYATNKSLRTNEKVNELIGKYDSATRVSEVLLRTRNQSGRYSVLCLYRVWGKPINDRSHHTDANNKHTLRVISEKLERDTVTPQADRNSFHEKLLLSYEEDPMLRKIYKMRNKSLGHTDGIETKLDLGELETFLRKTAVLVDDLLNMAAFSQEHPRFSGQFDGILATNKEAWSSLIVD